MNLPLVDVLHPGMRGAFYGRHSTDKQTMETQKSMAYELAQKYGCTIVKEYLDAGVSARKKHLQNRPGAQDLLRDAKNYKFQFVVICNHDRIARDPVEHQQIRIFMALYNIPIVISSSESLYDSGDFIVDLIKDGVSKLEVDNTRIRTRDTTRSLVRNQKWSGGKPPYGYRYDVKTKQITACDDELQLVRSMYQLYKNKEGFQSIATILSKEAGNTFKKDFVRSIITNPFYAGYKALYRTKRNSRNSFTPMEQWMMVKFDNVPAIMTLDEWKETWMIFEERKNGTIPPKMYKTSFLLSNLVTCSHCNNLLTTDDQTTFDRKRNKYYGKKYYCCNTCNYKIESNRLHKTVEVIISDVKSRQILEITDAIMIGLHNDKQNLTRQILINESKLKDLMTQIQQFTSKIKEILNSMDMVDSKNEKTNLARILQISRQQVEIQVQELNKTLDEQRKRLSNFEKIQMNKDSIIKALTNLSHSIVGIDDEQLRKMLIHLIEKATVTIDSKKENQYKDEKGAVLKGSISYDTRQCLFQSNAIF